MIVFTLLHPWMTYEALGELPYFLSEADPRGAEAQFNANYPFGGFQLMKGFSSNSHAELKYPGDPAMKPLAKATLRGETIYVYESAWVVIFQPDNSFVIARMD